MAPEQSEAARPASPRTCTRWRSCCTRLCAASIPCAARRRPRRRGASDADPPARSRPARPASRAHADDRRVACTARRRRAARWQSCDEVLEQALAGRASPAGRRIVSRARRSDRWDTEPTRRQGQPRPLRGVGAGGPRPRRATFSPSTAPGCGTGRRATERASGSLGLAAAGVAGIRVGARRLADGCRASGRGRCWCWRRSRRSCCCRSDVARRVARAAGCCARWPRRSAWSGSPERSRRSPVRHALADARGLAARSATGGWCSPSRCSAGRLWLGSPGHLPARSAWEGSVQTTAVHVIGPLLSLGVLLGAAAVGPGRGGAPADRARPQRGAGHRRGDRLVGGAGCGGAAARRRRAGSLGAGQSARRGRSERCSAARSRSPPALCAALSDVAWPHDSSKPRGSGAAPITDRPAAVGRPGRSQASQ